MKFLLVLLLSLLPSQALAAPRVTTAAGAARLTFNLPGSKPVDFKASVSGTRLSVRLSTPLKPERGLLTAPGLKGYVVEPGGKLLTVTFASTHRPQVQLLAAQAGQPQRLVIDVLKGAAPPAQAGAAAVARPTSTRPSTSPRPLARPRVVIDPGHGGRDPGMVSRYLREKDVTLAVGLRVRDLLAARGVDVVMTRTGDYHLSAAKRADLDARSNLARAGTVSAYISIHVNAGSPNSRGVETYYFGQPTLGANRALAIQENGAGSIGQELTRAAASTAQNLLGDILAQAKLSFSRQLAAKVQQRLVGATGAPDRGVHTNTFYVIRDPNTAAILTEIGFGDSAKEGPLLVNRAYQDRVASAIAGAILDFLHMKK